VNRFGTTTRVLGIFIRLFLSPRALSAAGRGRYHAAAL